MQQHQSNFRKKFFNRLISLEQSAILLYLIKWLFLCTLVGILSGSASAIFLILLDWATGFREENVWIIALLPLGGLSIGLVYHYFGESVVKGNNQLIEEFHSPKKIIPLRMAPLVLFGTIVTHLFGGSAGREGTAVQMGGAFAYQFTHLFKLKDLDRKILLVTGVSAGFASVFGTPLAGAVFALEVFIIGRMRFDAILPAFLAAVIADYVFQLWPIVHVHYIIPVIPGMNIPGLLWAILAGIIFGLAALLFSKAIHFWGNTFKSVINYPPLRPVIGGVVIALAVWVIGTTKYIGLGIPTITASFKTELPFYRFLAMFQKASCLCV